MTGGPGRGKLEEHIMALLAIGGQPKLYINLWLYFISSQAASIMVQIAFFYLGIFRERFTANQKHFSKFGFF
jgi:hypothetical protein